MSETKGSIKGEHESTCLRCGSIQCNVNTYGKHVKKMHKKDGGLRDGRKEKGVYRLFTYLKYSYVGEGTEIPCPICVAEKMKYISKSGWQLHSISKAYLMRLP